MQEWMTLPKKKRARQWKQGELFEGVFHERENLYFVITIHGQKAYLTNEDFVVEEPDGKHHYPCRPDIWLASHQLCES